jgi:hypothetical protein
MNINMPLDTERHEDLKLIQDYYSRKTGSKVSQAQALRRLLFETANLIRNTGETYPNRDWVLENQEQETHSQYKKKKGEVHGGK